MAAFTAVEMYRPIEEAKYGDIVCVDPRIPGVKNTTRWMFLGRTDDGLMNVMILSAYTWAGQIVTFSRDEFVVVRP